MLLQMFFSVKVFSLIHIHVRSRSGRYCALCLTQLLQERFGADVRPTARIPTWRLSARNPKWDSKRWNGINKFIGKWYSSKATCQSSCL